MLKKYGIGTVRILFAPFFMHSNHNQPFLTPLKFTTLSFRLLLLIIMVIIIYLKVN